MRESFIAVHRGEHHNTKPQRLSRVEAVSVNLWKVLAIVVVGSRLAVAEGAGVLDEVMMKGVLEARARLAARRVADGELTMFVSFLLDRLWLAHTAVICVTTGGYAHVLVQLHRIN